MECSSLTGGRVPAKVSKAIIPKKGAIKVTTLVNDKGFSIDAPKEFRPHTVPIKTEKIPRCVNPSRTRYLVSRRTQRAILQGENAILGDSPQDDMSNGSMTLAALDKSIDDLLARNSKEERLTVVRSVSRPMTQATHELMLGDTWSRGHTQVSFDRQQTSNNSNNSCNYPRSSNVGDMMKNRLVIPDTKMSKNRTKVKSKEDFFGVCGKECIISHK